jgi:hypothetical protein
VLRNLNLFGTSLGGTVPATLCNMATALSIFVDCNPGLQCSCCTCG